MAEKISDLLSLSRTGVIATLISLEEIIPELLTSVHTVKLDELGTFSLQARTQISEEEIQVTWCSFKKLIVRFKASKALKILMQDVNFKRATIPACYKSAPCQRYTLFDRSISMIAPWHLFT